MPKFLKWDFALKGIRKVFKGRHFQFLLKFGPASKREIEVYFQTKVMYSIRGETWSQPSTHHLQGGGRGHKVAASTLTLPGY